MAMVIYDSAYGNTKLIAEARGQQSLKVLPTRFELISMVPETIILSVELREQCCKYRIFPNLYGPTF
jgi:hypothetical protein